MSTPFPLILFWNLSSRRLASSFVVASFHSPVIFLGISVRASSSLPTLAPFFFPLPCSMEKTLVRSSRQHCRRRIYRHLYGIALFQAFGGPFPRFPFACVLVRICILGLLWMFRVPRSRHPRIPITALMQPFKVVY